MQLPAPRASMTQQHPFVSVNAPTPQAAQLGAPYLSHKSIRWPIDPCDSYVEGHLCWLRVTTTVSLTTKEDSEKRKRK